MVLYRADPARTPADEVKRHAATPNECGYAVTRPGPQPMSATGPASAGRTSSANAPSIARSSGLASRAVRKCSAYSTAMLL